jgi:L-cysteate sulfo-lyase
MSQQVVSGPTTQNVIRERVDQLPRVRIAHLPTPLEEMPRFRETLGSEAPPLFVKREDLTGLAFGGNKVRHLEFRLGDIRARRIRVVSVETRSASPFASTASPRLCITCCE